MFSTRCGYFSSFHSKRYLASASIPLTQTKSPARGRTFHSGAPGRNRTLHVQYPMRILFLVSLEKISRISFDSFDPNEKPGTRPDFSFGCPREESNITCSVPDADTFPRFTRKDISHQLRFL